MTAPEFNNVCLFILDSLRWDCLPRRIANDGEIFKTVAQSTFSAPSFATLATGRYPQEHGVRDWGDTTTAQTIFDSESHDGGFYQTGNPETEAIFDVLSVDSPTPLDDLEPPFLYLERDTKPHTPFGEYDTVEEYYHARGDNWDKISSDYRDGINNALEVFDERKNTICERGLEDDTLIILTSDHGELLGEYGEVAHTSPSTSELCVVPTVFFHPKLSADDFLVEDEIIEHVDVIETAMSNASADVECSGVDLFSRSRPRSWGYNNVVIRRRGRTFYEADSIWWADGSGHRFHRNQFHDRLLMSLYRVVKSAERHAIRTNLFEIIGEYAKQSRTFGVPPISAKQAENELAELKASMVETSSKSVEFDEATREQLENLGYLDI